jgi:hypothetical protein
VFTLPVDFYKATFNEKAEFHQATFKEATFSYAVFRQEGRFADATFEKRVTFDNATFCQLANFYKATFNEKAEFPYAAFKADASFPEAAFNQEASFSWATVEGGADFSACTFQGNSYFFQTKFKETVRFHGEKTFETQNIVDFRSTEIDKPERFSFYSVVLRPSWFVNADAIRKINFTDVQWYGLPVRSLDTIEEEIKLMKRRGKDAFQPSNPHELLAKTYLGLSANAEENRDYLKANEFHYLSMETQRKEGLSRLGIIATLYWLLSRYGDRPLYAFGVLVGMWVAFAALYFLLIESSPFYVCSASDVGQGMDYAGQALVYSLSALTRLNPRPQSEEFDWFQTLVTFEGIIGPLQIALFLLAVRRRVMR